MKRADLRVGMEIAYGSDTYPDGPAIVIDTRPWKEDREYMGRFGYRHLGIYRQVPDGRGVAVAEYIPSQGYWRPGVVMLSNIRRTWAEETERRNAARAARAEAEDRDGAYKARVARLPAALDPDTVYMSGHGMRGYYRRDRVTVDIDVLEGFLADVERGRR